MEGNKELYLNFDEYIRQGELVLGAIIGDIVGSRWEFNPTNDYDFEWLSKENGFTDDTICTVPVALWIIGQSTSFEEAVRKAVALGADADTLGAIVGSIAEAIWGIPESMKTEIMTYLPDEMKAVVEQFYEHIK